uniref:Uncharacterized protein n=1 Tax=Anguilla anguilla TaxID=7936 RepID=A0A0E9R228_ANGAN
MPSLKHTFTPVACCQVALLFIDTYLYIFFQCVNFIFSTKEMQCLVSQ